jgi:hypothetical protein
MALHLADLVDQEGVHGSQRSVQFLIDQRNEAIGFNAIASHWDKWPIPDVSEDDTMPAQPNRLEADPLSLLSEFQSQEASQPVIPETLNHPLQHGGLAAAGGAGQEQILGGAGWVRHRRCFWNVARPSVILLVVLDPVIMTRVPVIR